MKPTEAAALLTIAASFDNRKVDADQAKAWAMALDDLRFVDCREAIINHYRRGNDWLMPSHVIAEVKRVRNKRVMDFGPTDPPSGLSDAEYARWLAETHRAIADGTYVAPAPAEIAQRRDVIRELGQAQSVDVADAVRDPREAHAEAKRDLQAAASEEKHARAEKHAAREAAREADRKAVAASTPNPNPRAEVRAESPRRAS